MKRMRIGIVGALWAMLILGGCGGGGGSTANVTTPGKNAVAASISTSVPAAICPTGGIAINTGIDSNGNGVLDAAEITNTQYVCNGAAAANALMSVTDEPAGANCTAGGKKISVGLDTDNNGTLDPAEVTSSNYICNGTSGANGLNTLVSTTGEAPGANCVYGGLKVNSGLDSNSNGTLDAAEITNTSYACNVSAGSGGFSWVEVTASSVQAASNMGYMTNSASQVVVTLPAAPAIGDVVKVSAAGTGGCKIVSNPGQVIALNSFVSNPSAFINRSRSFSSVASSADGSKLVAATGTGTLFNSSDSGATWQASDFDSTFNWSAVASSGDGSKQVAVASNGQIYTSVDAGLTWTKSTNIPANNWTSVASSTDGSKLVATAWSGQIYTSADSGVTWTLQANIPANNWTSVASSTDGSKLVATVWNGQIYTSADSGVTWTLQANSPVASWRSVASSADGSKLVAVADFDQIYTSGDGGVTWTLQANSPVANWGSITSSADGSKLAATVVTSTNVAPRLYTSSDSGVTWTLQQVRGQSLSAVASSADGSKLVAVGEETTLISADSGSTWANTNSFSLRGLRYSTIELQYFGDNVYVVTDSSGAVWAY